MKDLVQGFQGWSLLPLQVSLRQRDTARRKGESNGWWRNKGCFRGTTNRLSTLQGRHRLGQERERQTADGSQKTSVEESLAQAEKTGQLAEAQIAKALGYHLCHCSFPPQIMLTIGYDEHGREQFRCPKCNMIAPPPLREIKVEKDFELD